MRRMSSCLAAISAVVVFGCTNVDAAGLKSPSRGFGFEHRAARLSAVRPHRHVSADRVRPEARFQRHPLRRRAFLRKHPFGAFGAYPFGYGLPLAIEDRAYAPQPVVFDGSDPDPYCLSCVPTVLGIRQAPAGQPTLYVLYPPTPVSKGAGRAPDSRPGPRVLSVESGPGAAQAPRDAGSQGGIEAGPRIVHLSVPRGRPAYREPRRRTME